MTEGEEFGKIDKLSGKTVKGKRNEEKKSEKKCLTIQTEFAKLI